MKPKILIFIDWYKPGFKAGGPIRSISNFVDYFAEKLDIYIVTSNTDYLDNTPYKSIKSNNWSSINSANVFYLSAEQTSYKTIKKLILEINPNTIYCNSLYSLYFSLIPIYIAKKEHIKTILAVRGMLSRGSLGVKSFKKKVFLTVCKLIGLFKKCTFHATNSNEKNDIQSTFGTNSIITVVQNLPEKKDLPNLFKKKEVNTLQLVFIGRIAPEKNTLFALECLKNVSKNVFFDIYGPIYSEEYWSKCKSIINQLPSNIVVKYKGVLNHNEIDNTLKNYHTLFLPSTGENFGHIIIEAMRNSCIPLISDQTPWVNLEEKKVGFDISLDDKNAFAATVDKLALMDEKTLNEISKKSHQFAINIINDKKLIEDYHKLFQLN